MFGLFVALCVMIPGAFCLCPKPAEIGHPTKAMAAEAYRLPEAGSCCRHHSPQRPEAPHATTSRAPSATLPTCTDQCYCGMHQGWNHAGILPDNHLQVRPITLPAMATPITATIPDRFTGISPFPLLLKHPPGPSPQLTGCTWRC